MIVHLFISNTDMITLELCRDSDQQSSSFTISKFFPSHPLDFHDKLNSVIFDLNLPQSVTYYSPIYNTYIALLLTLYTRNYRLPLNGRGFLKAKCVDTSQQFIPQVHVIKAFHQSVQHVILRKKTYEI